MALMSAVCSAAQKVLTEAATTELYEAVQMVVWRAVT
jgi:hypothetical protein